MNPLLNGWRYAVACALLAGVPVAAACSDNAASSESNQTDAALEILFPKMYSAYDGVHAFRIPAMVVGVKSVKWSAEPDDAVELEKQADGSVLITVKKVADVTIHAKAGNLQASAPLKITQATPEEWNEGNERYNNGVVWQRGGERDGGGGDGGARGQRKVDPTLSCTNCHNRGGKGGDVEHTPMQTGGYTDDELVTIFSEGKKPPGVKMRTMPRERWENMHKWKMEPNEKKGLVIYLRSLEPEAQGEVDFGGRGGGGRGRGQDGNRGDTPSRESRADAGDT